MKTPLLAAVLLPLTALAQSWRPAPEPLPAPAPVLRAPAAVPLSPGRTDDVRDLWAVDATLAQLDRAVATRNHALLRWVDGRARGLLDDERRETWNEMERARFARDRWWLRNASWKLNEVTRLENAYRTVAWRLDPWSVSQRRTILVDLDRLNRHELAVR